MGKPRGERVDGVLLLDKSGGMSSNFALQKARRLMNAAKAGHTGTLDPMATGLLPVTLGEATKFSADLLDADKAYEATIRFGATTTTGDAEGEVIETRPVSFSRDQLDAAMARLRGTIQQVPPMHSALKRDGKPLYELARAGIEVERAPRTVVIHRFELIELDGEQARVTVDCSKGTYIRVLAEDLGRALGCGAHLIALRRTRVGQLTLDGAVSLERMGEMTLDERRVALAPADRLLASLARVDLDETLAARLRQGQRLAIECPDRGRVRVYGPQQELLGTALVNERGVLAPERLIAS